LVIWSSLHQRDQLAKQLNIKERLWQSSLLIKMLSRESRLHSSLQEVRQASFLAQLQLRAVLLWLTTVQHGECIQMYHLLCQRLTQRTLLDTRRWE
jgi:hypothetical protein